MVLDFRTSRFWEFYVFTSGWGCTTPKSTRCNLGLFSDSYLLFGEQGGQLKPGGYLHGSCCAPTALIPRPKGSTHGHSYLIHFLNRLLQYVAVLYCLHWGTLDEHREDAATSTCSTTISYVCSLIAACYTSAP